MAGRVILFVASSKHMDAELCTSDYEDRQALKDLDLLRVWNGTFVPTW